MFKKYSLLFFFLACAGFGFGQTKEIDSLKYKLTRTKLNDTTKINLYLKLCELYYSHNIDSLGQYAKLAIKVAKESDDYFLESALNYRGNYHSDKNQMDSARYYFKRVIEIGKSKKDTITIANGYANYETTLRDRADFEEKVELGLKILKLLKNNKYELGESQYNLSVNYSNAGYDSIAIKYLKLATKNAEESSHDILLSYTLGNLLHYQIRNNELGSAKSNLNKLLELCNKIASPRICSHYYLRAGLFHDKLEEYDQAEIAYKNALENVKQLNDLYDLMYTYQSLGEHFVLAKKPKQAIDNFQKFQAIYLENEIPDLGVKAYENWAKAEKMVGNFENSNTYLEKYVRINNSINSEKNKSSIANAESKYQSEKKDKEIAEQKLVLADKELALTQSKSKTRTMSILIVSLLLASILLWFLFQQRQKRIQQQLVTIQREQEVRTLESLMEGEEKERFRIAKELHDGVNGDLSAIKFKLSSLMEMNNSVIKEAVTMIDNSCEQVRAISHNLVPPSLKDFNLVEAVEEYCQSMNSIHDPEIHFQQVGDTINLDKKQEANLFRIVQELVTNSIKHAGAKEINVQLSHLENTVQLTVEDDGKGFDPKTVKNTGIGMQNVRSRVDYLNATMDFLSNEKGTSYTIAMDTKNQVL